MAPKIRRAARARASVRAGRSVSVESREHLWSGTFQSAPPHPMRGGPALITDCGLSPGFAAPAPAAGPRARRLSRKGWAIPACQSWWRRRCRSAQHRLASGRRRDDESQSSLRLAHSLRGHRRHTELLGNNPDAWATRDGSRMRCAKTAGLGGRAGGGIFLDGSSSGQTRRRISLRLWLVKVRLANQGGLHEDLYCGRGR